MTLFWISAGGLALGVVGLLIVPFLRRPSSDVAARAAYDLTVYRDQLTEVERDLERGLLSDGQADDARTEIQRRMLAAGSEEDETPAEPSDITPWRANRAIIATVAVLVPLGAIGLYASTGSPGMPGMPVAEREAETPAMQGGEVAAMVDRLAERLKTSPDDLKGWTMLGRSYRSMGRQADSAAAYKRAVDLSKRRADLLGAYGEALVLAADNKITDEAVAIFNEVLGKEPLDPRPYYYLAMKASETADMEVAIQHWVNLLAISPAEAPWVPDIRKSIETAATMLGVKPDSVKPTVKVPPKP